MSYNMFRPRCTWTRWTRFRTPNLGVRHINFSATQRKALRGWGTVFNILAGGYAGGLLVSGGSLYFLYEDAQSRQHIPFELLFEDQMTAVKAINKDDVLKSPRHAVKHYRRLLINMAKNASPDTELDEASIGYDVPIIDADYLINKKSNDFANFYVDIVLRYAKALLAKGEIDSSIRTLDAVIGNNDLFYRLGSAERMSQCCRLLSKVCPDDDQKVQYLTRSIDMLEHTFTAVDLDENYLLQTRSTVTDELFACLNSLAFTLAKSSTSKRRKVKEDLLSKSLNIYLANLKTVTQIQQSIASGKKSQNLYPLFNCSEDNLALLSAEIQAHISEVMWAKGYKKNAISWGEQAVESIYYDHSTSPKASVIVSNVLSNLIKMYDSTKDVLALKRCHDLKSEVVLFDVAPKTWYDSFVNRICKIVYYRGPLGVLEKGIKERFGPPERVPELEEYEDEDEE